MTGAPPDRDGPEPDRPHEGGEPIDPAVLAAYEVPAPSSDLTERFLRRRREAGAGEGAGAGAPRWRRWAPVTAAAGIALALGAGWWLGRATAPGGARGAAQTGALTAPERREIALAPGDVAVAEPGAQLRWRVEGSGATRVEQLAGDVFYRVEPGRAFVVEAAAATVASVGTCFRVEVEAAGAAGGEPAAVITVYEGAVTATTAAGASRIAAGDRVRVRRAGPPERLARGEAVVARQAGAAGDAPTVAALEARVAQLEAELRRRPALDAAGARTLFDFSPGQLAELARRCHVPFDLPPFPGSSVMETVLEHGFATVGLTADERRVVARVLAQHQAARERELRALYSELSGESGDALDALSLLTEIISKSPRADVDAAQRVVSRERAGLAAPPDARAAASRSVIERMLRLAIEMGDAVEADLARELPAARVRQLRRTWGGANLGPACPAAP